MIDYYEILGISAFSTSIEIKERFQYLAQAYHPDKFPSPQHKVKAEEDFKLINEAYQTLSNSTRKSIYDNEYWQFKEKNLKQNNEATVQSVDNQEVTITDVPDFSKFPAQNADFYKFSPSNGFLHFAITKRDRFNYITAMPIISEFAYSTSTMSRGVREKLNEESPEPGKRHRDFFFLGWF
jgi:curved DNA-binding protein CbpA